MILINKRRQKIFCVSIQRTGTTSTGMFFKDFGFSVADWPMSQKNNWTYHWDQGDFETIFKSNDFKNHQVFEDDPWWLPNFYKVLYHRFPGAKFILFTRDANTWFKSMLNHSNGMVIGDIERHCRIYRREKEYDQLLIDSKENTKPNNSMSLKGCKNHYTYLYNLHNRDVQSFFNINAPEALFSCELEDPLKWKKLGAFIGIEIPENYDVHVHRS